MDANPYKSPTEGYRRWPDVSPFTLTVLKILLAVYLAFMGGMLVLGLIYMLFVWWVISHFP